MIDIELQRARSAMAESVTLPIATWLEVLDELEALRQVEPVKQEPVLFDKWDVDEAKSLLPAMRQGVALLEYVAGVLPKSTEPVKQEPVAWMSPGKERLEFSRKDTVYGSHTIPLYTAPPTCASLAALAARQMRDFVFTALLAAETPYTQMTMMQKKVFGDAIAALPVPEVQWRDLTDGEIEEVCISLWSGGWRQKAMNDFARAVITAFKEKNR